MICYFSGTGNSHWVAQTMATTLQDKLVNMAAYYDTQTPEPQFDITPSEWLGIVCPIHSWGVPPLVVQFVQRLQTSIATPQHIFVVFTCGDECGNADRQMRALLSEKGWATQHIYSVQMPNNYIVFPGFDVDSKAIEVQKKEAAKQTLPTLLAAIKADKPIAHYKRGSLPYIKSHFIYPQFCKHMMSSKSFHTTDACIGCGLCAQVCPIGTIDMVAKKPVWKTNCTQCLSCIHHCPTQAIQYGNTTQKKGRYVYR
ncbi:MAG: EFR1 family ferrodoxin [Paludibacteraceae bacterium]